MSLFTKTIKYFRENGLKATHRKLRNWYAIHYTDVNDYQAFLRRNSVRASELARQRRVEFTKPILFSVVVPLYHTPERYLRELIESLMEQTYGNWELVLADGSRKEGETESPLKRVVQRIAGNDTRVKYYELAKNEGISGNTNAGFALASGDYIVLADHDDFLSPDALYSFREALEKQPGIDILYSDEDKVDESGKKFFEPNLKPDFNVDYLNSTNYICHLLAFKRSFYERFGGLDSKYDGAQDFDLILRYAEQAQTIVHVPKVLYHWRKTAESTAAKPENKLYAYEHGAQAVEAHWKRLGIPAHVEQGAFYGIYHTVYDWEEQPLISILVPNKDHVEDLKICMRSIDENSSYRNYEWIIIENNSTEPETFAYYKEIEQRDNVKVLYYEGGFNYSRINNFGAKAASGSYLLLLNNDTEMMGTEGLWELLGPCQRSDVGIVGAKLYYQDDTIQHAGVVIGAGGIAGHAFTGLGRGIAGYGLRAVCAQNYNAVTAACLMVKKSVYDEVGGLDEEYAVAFNDVDFCMRVRENGHLIVWNPYAEWHHYESKSRGLEDSDEKRKRFQQEINRFADRWKDMLVKGDPYYNPNLSIRQAEFQLRVEDEDWVLPVIWKPETE